MEEIEEQIEQPTPRQRNIAHIWADKRILRFFRKTLPKLDYKNVRNVYLALCEIDSDFVEERNSETKSIHALTNTCVTYAGMDQAIVSQALQYLKIIGLIDYGRKIINGKFAGSYLTMYVWDEKRAITNIKENQYKGKSGSIKNINRYIKNTLINKLINIRENSFSKEKEASNEATVVNDLYSPKDNNSSLSIQELYPIAFARLEFWNSQTALPTHRLQKTKLILTGLRRCTKFLKKYTPEQIDSAIRKYAELLGSPYTKLNPIIPGHKVSFAEFFGFDAITLERMKKRNVDLGDYGSWFEKIIVGDYGEFVTGEKPKDTQVFYRLQNLYKEHFGELEYKFTDKEVSQLTMATNKLLEFYSRVKSQIIFDFSVLELADDMVTALENTFGVDNVTVGHFCSRYTFNTVLPRFMNSMGMLDRSEVIQLI